MVPATTLHSATTQKTMNFIINVKPSNTTYQKIINHLFTYSIQILQDMFQTKISVKTKNTYSCTVLSTMAI
jgi:hypothetical protein